MSEVFPSPVILNFFDPIVDIWLSKGKRSIHVKKTVGIVKNEDSQEEYHEVIITTIDDGLSMTFKGDTINILEYLLTMNQRLQF
jgi:hypothetical protein